MNLKLWIFAAAPALLGKVCDGFSVSSPFVPSTASQQGRFLPLLNSQSNNVTEDIVSSSQNEDEIIMKVNGAVLEEEDAVNDDEEEKEPIVIEEETHDEPKAAMEAESLIVRLLQLASRTGRGEFATPSQHEEALEAIAALQDINPTSEPTLDAPKIEGTWELVYSNTQLFRSSPFFMAGRAVCETPEQAEQYDWFCDMHRAALAISTIGAVRQVISSSRLVSEFEVKVGAVPFLNDLTPFSYSGGLPLTIEGAIVSSADITAVDDGTAWEIFMDTVEIKGSNLPLLRQVLDAGLKLGSRDLGAFLEQNVPTYTNPKPLFTTMYLSESMRISKDQDGKVFVYSKVSDKTEPTDYKNVMPDLGLTKLVAGFNDAVTKLYL